MLSPTQKEILRFALPLTLGNVSQMMLNIVDSAMVGQLSYEHLAASSLVNNMIGIPFVLFIGFSAVISTLVAERKGAGDETSCGHLLNNAVYLNLISCILLISTLYAFKGIIHHLNQEEDVVELAKPFLNWMLWSIVPMVVYFSIKQFCDGLGYTRIPMILSLLSIPFNAGLNYLLIYGNFGFPRLELAGSGIATFITRILLAIGLGIFVLYNPVFLKYKIQNRIFDKALCKKIFNLALPSGWQYSSEVAAFAILAIVVGWFGAVQQAAHQIAISIAAMTFMVSLGISTACSIKIGSAFGAGQMDRVKAYGGSVVSLAIYYAIFCALIFICFNSVIPLLFNNDPEVCRIASYLLFFAAAFQIVDSVQCVGIGMLRGLQDTRLPSYYTTFAYLFIGIPAGIILGHTLKMEVYGIWVAFIICLTVMAILLIRRFNKLVP